MTTITQFMVTTTDNPFDPFTQYEQWDRFDCQHGYYTMNYLMRLANVSTDLTDQEYEDEIEAAVDTICRLNVLGIYKKVSTKTKVS